MEKETFKFKRISIRKEFIYRIYLTKSLDKPCVKIIYKRYDPLTNGNSNIDEFDFIFNNDILSLDIYDKLINHINNSKDSDIINFGLIIDNLKIDFNSKLEKNELEFENMDKTIRHIKNFF